MQSELRLAKRIALLGTETAFKLLAQALEAQRRDIDHTTRGRSERERMSQIAAALKK